MSKLSHKTRALILMQQAAQLGGLRRALAVFEDDARADANRDAVDWKAVEVRLKALLRDLAATYDCADGEAGLSRKH